MTKLNCEKKTVLVTGSAGFLGSHVVEELLSRGYFVIGIDNFFRGKIENLSMALSDPRFKFYNLDILNSKAIGQLKDILFGEDVSAIYHLAAINGTEYFYDSSLMVMDSNIKMIQVLLESIKDTKVEYVAYTSSSEVYGEPLAVPTPEHHPILLNVNAKRDSYASSKAIGDFYIRLATDALGIKSSIFRVFNLYGPRMVGTKYGQVIGEFVNRVFSKEVFTIIGDGSHTRSFCLVTDAARIMVDLYEIAFTGSVNVGNDYEITILKLAELIHSKAGRAFSPVFLPERPNDHKRRCPDLEKLKSCLPDVSFTNLDNGLDITIKHFLESTHGTK